MWTAKLSSKEGGGFLRQYAVKFNVMITGYPISSYQFGKYTYTNIVGIVSGEENNKRKCLSALSREKENLSFESKKDFFIMTNKEPSPKIALYFAMVLYLKPIVLYPTGEYILEIGSWQKDKIQRFITVLKKEWQMKLLKLSKEEIGTISFIGVPPELTGKQKAALEIAIKNGYYDFPRKIDLEKLSKIMRVSLSTYRQHLRVAERKFIAMY